MRFLMSPGVMTREIDASQYAVTTTTGGNSVALVGYAEKGPFDPVIVANQQDFEQTFGATLPESPYLAMTANKLLAQGQQVMVVRAGDDRDPMSVPLAAKQASKQVRVIPKLTQIVATSGYQQFNFSDSFIASGAFAPGAEYSFNLLADDRAFKSPKYMETWTGKVYETYNGMGDTVHSLMQGVVAKVAMSTSTATSFTLDYKSINATPGAASFGQYSGTGTRDGSALGNSLVASLVRYRTNNSYGPVETDTLSLRLKYGAAEVGSANIASGLNFGTTAKKFSVRIATTTVEFDLVGAYANDAAIVLALNSQAALSNISGKIEFGKFSTDYTTFNLSIKRIQSGSDTDGFELIAGATGENALTTLGLTAGVRENASSIFGTFTATAPIGADVKEFAGEVILTRDSTTNNAVSFEDRATIKITSPAIGKWDKAVILSDINTALANAYPDYASGIAARATAALSEGKIRLTALSPNTETTNSMVEITSSSSGISLVGLLNGSNSMTPAVAGIDAAYQGESVVQLIAKEKGSYGNKLALKVESLVRKIDASKTIPVYNVYVYYNGKEQSSYIGIYWGDGSAKDSKGTLIGADEEQLSSNYILTKMAADKWISIVAEDENGDSTMGRLPDGLWTLGDSNLPNTVTSDQAEVVDFTVGTNGWVEDNGSITSMTSDYIASLIKISNPEVFDFNLLSCPGSADTAVQVAVQEMCENRRDCFGVIDGAPFGYGLGVRNGTVNINQINEMSSNLTSSYVGVYWPWLQDYDAVNKQYVWLPPSTYALNQIVYTDSVSDPWFAPAGNRRGRVSAVDIEYSPTNSDRDILYGAGNIVNPIVKFVNEGLTIWGQKTAQRTPSATDRINVRRLLIYAERLVARMARTFLFEPNDSANWASFARQANAIMEPIRQRRGVYQYTVICDATTNTADLINQNIMAGKIFLQPMKSIEFIEVSFTVDAATGATTVTE